MRSKVLFVAALFLSVLAPAQSGTAPPGYYPMDYGGSIFKGIVTETGAARLVLSPVKGKNPETFEGIFERGCSVPTASGQIGSLMPADIVTGTEMTVFFKMRTRKADGNKVKENVVIGISFDTWQGRKIAETDKKLFYCVDSSNLQFKYFR